MSIKHWLAHQLGWNEGDIQTRSVGDSVIVWFRCAGCGKVSGIHRAPEYLFET